MARDGYAVVSSHLRSEEAEMLRGLLESAGLETLVEDAAMASLNPLLQSAVGGAKVLVPSADAARAHEIITSSGVFAGSGAGSEEIPEEEWAATGFDTRVEEPAPVASPRAEAAPEREAQARHALGAALAAMLLFATGVVPLYALAAAVRFFRMRGAASARARTQAGWALALAAVALALAALGWIGVVASPGRTEPDQAPWTEPNRARP
jgi:hypothetical protein